MPCRHSLFLALAAVLLPLTAAASSPAAPPPPPDLAAVFRDPPVAARPYVWWHWMGPNFSTAGITKDLEAMAAAGIGGATIFNLTSAVQETQAPTQNNPWPDQTYRSHAYWTALRHAASEARRLGLEVGLHNTVGYSTTGGPWIDEERAIQKLVWRSVEAATTTATDSSPATSLRVHLPRPDAPRYSGYGSMGQIAKFYRDIAILALPAGDAPVPPQQVHDLSSLLGPDDQLTWTPPTPGRWQFLRFGHAPTGYAPHPVPDDLIGKVLEADKLSLAQTRHHWENVLAPLATELGQPVGQHLRHFLIDSYEAGHQSWTPGLRETFRQRYGYDPIRWLPTLGQPLRGGDPKKTNPLRLLGDEALTARFEHDYRTLVSDLYYENGWKPAADLIRAAGATLQFEPYTGPFDTYEGTALADLPMGEFWTGGKGGIDHRIVAAARAAGRTLVGAEAFTGRPEISQWTETPAFLKLSADGTFASGVNRLILHHWVHQPFDDRHQPGMGMGWWGTHFGRHQTWFEPGQEFFRYLGSVQALLQRGETPADHLSVAAAENNGDAIAWRGFRETLTVRDGLVHTPVGRAYRLLHVPHSGALAPADVRRLAELIRAGATVVSPRPSRSPGLANYPACDAEVAALATELWGPAPADGQPPADDAVRPLGAGRLFVSGKLPAARRALGLRDFVGLSGDSWKHLRTHHRRETPTAPGRPTDLVFIANLSDQAQSFTATFGLFDRAPELWDAETGTRTAAPPSAWRVADGRTELRLTLGAVKSVFVVFPPRPSPDLAAAPAPLSPSTSTPLAGPWRVEFASPVDTVAPLEFAALASLSEHPEPAVRHFAGTATYRLRFPAPAANAAAGERVFLDLGQVECIARVTLNGRDLGVLWHPPFRIEVTDALRPGDNELAVAVSTTWHNRLVGDEREPADFEWGKDRGPTMGRALGAYPEWFLKNQPRPSTGRKAFVTWFYHREDTPLRPSGLLGPVTLMLHSDIAPFPTRPSER
jgi:hypothetical protein